jgi:hypothetical protein
VYLLGMASEAELLAEAVTRRRATKIITLRDLKLRPKGDTRMLQIGTGPPWKPVQ